MAGPLKVLVVGPKHSAPDSRGGMATVVALMRDQRDDRVRVRTVATFVDDVAAVRLRVGVTGMLRSAALVLLRRTDVLHVHLAHGGSVVRKALPLLAARLARVPAVVHAHSFDFAGWFDALPTPMRWLVRRALPAQRWLVLGDDLAVAYRESLRLRPERVRVLRNPVRLPATVGDRSGQDRVVAVSLGRLGERKGSYDVVDAVAALPPGVRAGLAVVLAGDGELDEVRAAIAARGLADTVSVRAWLDPAERDALLAQAEVFLLPSRAEGVPMALLEAMAWALVPVTTAVGGIGEVVRDGRDCVLVGVGDVPALTAALARLVVDDPWRRELGAAARERARDFAVDAWFDELVDEWQRLSAGTRR